MARWLVCLGLGGCLIVIREPVCTDIAVASVTVRVRDDAGATVTDAVVTWGLSGAPTEACEGFGTGTWTCGYEVSGAITIRVEAEGFLPYQGVVQVSADECHVQTEQLTVSLERPDCTAQEVPSVLATVVSSTGEPLSGVAVAWRLEEELDEEPCQLVGAAWVCGTEVEGTIVVKAAADGHEGRTETVDVEADECHVLTEEVDLVLDPLPD